MKQAKKMSRSTKRLCRTAPVCTSPPTPPTARVGRMTGPQSWPPTPHWSSCSRNGLPPGATRPPLPMTSPLCLGMPCARSGWTETTAGSVMGLFQVAPSQRPWQSSHCCSCCPPPPRRHLLCTAWPRMALTPAILKTVEQRKCMMPLLTSMCLPAQWDRPECF